jgi:hypothetical protein
MAEPPSLPYARDEGSTSHAAAAYQYHPQTPYADTFDAEEEEEIDGSAEDDHTRETQYWAANRHRSPKDESDKDEEHGELLACLLWDQND